MIIEVSKVIVEAMHEGACRSRESHCRGVRGLAEAVIMIFACRGRESDCRGRQSAFRGRQND
jgi:hypothetical protein